MSSQSFNECLSKLTRLEITKQCFGLVLSKFLGVFIIIFSVTLKIPQIRLMLKDKSSIKALTEFSLFNDILCNYVILLYNIHFGYSFSSYGENVSIFLQNLIILLLFFKEVKGGFLRKISVFSLICIGFLCFSNVLPEKIWFFIGGSNVIFLVMSRLSTIINAFTNKNTGPLSYITFILASGGCVARIFTAINENGDLVMISTALLSFVLNFIILIEIFLYGNKKDKRN